MNDRRFANGISGGCLNQPAMMHERPATVGISLVGRARLKLQDRKRGRGGINYKPTYVSLVSRAQQQIESLLFESFAFKLSDLSATTTVATVTTTTNCGQEHPSSLFFLFSLDSNFDFVATLCIP